LDSQLKYGRWANLQVGIGIFTGVGTDDDWDMIFYPAKFSKNRLVKYVAYNRHLLMFIPFLAYSSRTKPLPGRHNMMCRFHIDNLM
jgi:hypothetical protein